MSPDLSLIPAAGLSALAEIYAESARRPGRVHRDWLAAAPEEDTRWIAKAMGHIHTHMMGRTLDNDSGFPHLAHAASNLLILIDRMAERERSGKPPVPSQTIPPQVAMPRSSHEPLTRLPQPTPEVLVESFPHGWKPKREHQERAMADWGMSAAEVIRCWMDCRFKPFARPNTPERQFHRFMDWWAKDKGLTPRLLARGNR